MWGWIKKLLQKIANAWHNWRNPLGRPVERDRMPLLGGEGDPARRLPPAQPAARIINPDSLEAWLPRNIDNIDNTQRAAFDSIIDNEFFRKTAAERTAYLLTDGVKNRLFPILLSARNFDAKTFLEKCVAGSLMLIQQLQASRRYQLILRGLERQNLMIVAHNPADARRLGRQEMARIVELIRRMQAAQRPREEFKLPDISATSVFAQKGIDAGVFEEFRCILIASIITGTVAKVIEGAKIYYYDDKALRKAVAAKQENPVNRNPLQLHQIQDGTEEYRDKVRKRVAKQIQNKAPGLSDQDAEEMVNEICDELQWARPHAPGRRP